MPPNEAPGSSSQTNEFYLRFWNVIRTYFVEVVRYCKNCGALSKSMNFALLTYLQELRREKRLKNWKSISLLNVDIQDHFQRNHAMVIPDMPFISNESQT